MNHKLQDERATLQQEYLAFISYRHSDNTEEDQQWATWLHNQLEVYDVPDDLIGTTNLRGEIIPAQIYPVFLDEVSLPTEADLSSAITQALDRSRFLIVLCSPGAVQSRYVNEEILHFKRTGKAGRIMAALIEGEPNASIDAAKIEDPDHRETLECFPSALQYALTVDDQLDIDNPSEPIAANFRLPDGSKGMTNPNVYKKLLLKQGRNKTDAERLAHLYEEQINNARLKIIAGILGVPLEQLTQRDKIYQLHKAQQATQRFRKIAFSMGVLALAALIAGGIAIAQWRIAKTQQERAENLLGEIQGNLRFMNIELRDVLDKYVPQHERLKIIHHIDTVVNILQQHGNQKSLEAEYQIAVALIQKGDKDLTNDKLNPAAALPLLQQGHNTIIKISQQDPSNTKFQYGLSVSYDRSGDLELRLGNIDAALKAYQDSLIISQTLTRLDPLNTEFQGHMSTSLNNFGDIQLRLGNTDLALKAYQDSLAISQTLNRLAPNNTKFQSHLSNTLNYIGELQIQLGNTKAALKVYQDSLAIIQALIRADPSNTLYQSKLSSTLNHIGELQIQLGNTKAALEVYQDSLAIIQALIKADPSNTLYQSKLSITLNHIGELQIKLGNTDAALKFYKDSLVIRQTLSKLDPSNTLYQSKLSITLNHIGELQMQIGNTDAAIKIYQDSLVIRQTLSKLDPSNADFNRELWITYSGLFEAYKAKKDSTAAKMNLEKALQIINVMKKNGTLAKDDEQTIKTMEVDMLNLTKKIKH